MMTKVCNSVSRKWSICLLAALLIPGLWANTSQAQIDVTVNSLLEDYAVIRLSYTSDEDLEAPLLLLLQQCEQLRDEHDENAAIWTVSALVRFAYANTQGPVTGMRQIGRSRDELEKAISLDPSVRDGYAKAYLGYLYSAMPSWPLSFGNKEKGRKLTEEALRINDKNIPNNYYHAWYLTIAEDYDAARMRLDMAEAAIVADPVLPKLQELLVVGIGRLRSQIDELDNKE